MWVEALYAAAAADSVPSSTVIAGVFAVIASVAAAWFGARGTLRTADNEREKAFDQRTDQRISKLEEQNAKLLEQRDAVIAERDRYREQYVQLRLGVMAKGLDPDELIA